MKQLNRVLLDDIKSIASRPVRATDSLFSLPPLPNSLSAPNEWDSIDGLSVEIVEGSAVVSGQRVLRLVAVGADGRHALGVRFGDLSPSQTYRAIACLKAEPGDCVMIEARDAVGPLTGKPSNYGVAWFNPAAHSVVNSNGDILASGVEAAEDDWVKVWVDLCSKDGQIFVAIGLVKHRDDAHEFEADGEEVTFGGFEISPPRPVQASLRASIHTPPTDIGELPPLSEFYLWAGQVGPDRWSQRRGG